MGDNGKYITVISDDVIAVIAGTACREVEGVADVVANNIANNIAGDLIDKFGRKNYGKGITIKSNEESIAVDVNISIKYKYNLKEVSENIQQKIKDTIETTTGKTVEQVNVNIVGVEYPKQPEITE